MRLRFGTLLLALTVVTACDGAFDPIADPVESSGDRGDLRNLVGSLDDLPLLGDLPDLPENVFEHQAEAPALASYEASVLATQGQRASLTLYYEHPRRTDRHGPVFLRLIIPATAQLVHEDGTPAEPGDEVLITAEVDSTHFAVRLSPHGSMFQGKRPARLIFNKTYAEPPVAGLVPVLWYQPTVGNPWTLIPQPVRIRGRWLVFRLDHFSNYAVAW